MSKSILVTILFLLAVFSAGSILPNISKAQPEEDTWTTLAPMQQARGGVRVATVNGRIYAIGGSNARGPYRPDTFGGDFLGTNEVYDPETDTWTYGAPMPTPRAHFAIAAFENKIYCIGGAIGFSVDEWGFYTSILSGVTEVYDTVTDTWETKRSMPIEAMKIQAHTINGKIFVMIGSLPYVYDPVDDSWSQKTRAPPPYPKSSPVSAVVDHRIIVTGEYAVGWNYTSVQKIMIYDTETDSWSEGATGPILVGLGAAGATTGVRAPQKVYVLGFMARPLNQVYDPKTDAWESAAAMSTNRSDFGVVIVDDILYAIGGYDHTSPEYGGIIPVAVNERYLPLGFEASPEIKIVFPVNQVYNVSDVSLVFTVDKPFSWLGYSLDGGENVTIGGNVTLTDLSNGMHSVIVYAEDMFGNVEASEIIHFSVEVPGPFPSLPVAAASVALVVVVATGLIVYFKKRKTREA